VIDLPWDWFYTWKHQTVLNGDDRMDTILMLHPRDNVAVAITSLKKEQKVQTKAIKEFVLLDDIDKSHKIALRNIAEGEEIIKYGEVIAISSMEIKKGQWVHTHNLKSDRWKK